MTIESDPALTNGTPIIREYLYADLDRARSLLSQRVGGVPEEDKITEGTNKKLTVGVKNVLGLDRDGKNEESVQRSLLDAVLPELEDILEAEGWLANVTDVLTNPTITPEDLQEKLPPGCLVKFTTDGHLFDARFLAEVLAGTSIIIDPMARLGGFAPAAPGISKGKKPSSSSRNSQTGTDGKLEDLIEQFTPSLLGDVKPDQLKDLVRISRGLFGNGLHLLLSTPGDPGWSITARLQEGKRYLDAEHEILFSRYGLDSQRWTVVGTVGHYAPQAAVSIRKFDFVTPDSRMDRQAFVQVLNKLLSFIANQGLSDAPSYPGFSIVPIAIYRPIPWVGHSMESIPTASSASDAY